MKPYLLIGVFCVFQSLAGQTFFDNAYGGPWEGSGVLLGKEATFKMNWEPVLQGQFVQLRFENDYVLSDGSHRKLEAHGYYQVINDTIVKGSWFDSRGINLPLQGSLTPTSLKIFWGSSDTEEGKTVYTYEDDIIRVVDYFLNDKGTYVKFGEAIYKGKNK